MSSISENRQNKVYLRDDEAGSDAMRIRLIYTGEIKASQPPHPSNGAEKKIANKHEIRKHFHRQLKCHWEENRFLSTHKIYPNDYRMDLLPAEYEARWAGDPNTLIPLSVAVSTLYQENGYSFVPLVRKDWSVSCALKILFLRHDVGPGAISAGDLDNRVKTIIDALSKPTNARQLAGHETPADGETPFYCLLEDDKLVTGLEVETDRLLLPYDRAKTEDMRQAHVVITADVRPTDATMFNLSFGF